MLLERTTPDRFQRAWEVRLRCRDEPRTSFTDPTGFAVRARLGFQILP